ncbi:MAG TPA: hypothetical protein VLW45_01305 [Pelomicrobium sp.]|nr:hypothetical protein [Pelomicrobium sp.]
MSAAAPYYRVTIAGNLVCAIERREGGGAVHPTPLDAASVLARAFQATGAIDGEYDFETPERARLFAELCLDFVAKLVERRSAELRELPAGAAYRAPRPAAPAGTH